MRKVESRVGISVRDAAGTGWWGQGYGGGDRVENLVSRGWAFGVATCDGLRSKMRGKPMHLQYSAQEKVEIQCACIEVVENLMEVGAVGWKRKTCET